MAKETVFRCDECNAVCEKKHYWLSSLCMGNDRDSINLDLKDPLDFCTMECLLSYLDKHLTRIKYAIGENQTEPEPVAETSGGPTHG